MAPFDHCAIFATNPKRQISRRHLLVSQKKETGLEEESQANYSNDVGALGMVFIRPVQTPFIVRPQGHTMHKAKLPLTG